MKTREECHGKKTKLVSRLLLVYALTAAWALVLFFRLFQLQVLEDERYRLQARQQQEGFIEVSARRGEILDRHLEELAVSVKSESVFAHPEQVTDPLQTASQLAPILDQPFQTIYKKLISDRSFVYLARKVAPRVSSEIRQLELPGIYLHSERKRVYPNRELAAHVLGFVGLDNEGLSGLEYLYNSLLQGEKTRIYLRMDARRNSYDRDPAPQPRNGHVLVLTLDRSIQYIVEQVLEEAVEQNGALNGSAIVMDPSTGEILAMASYPTFNPNSYADYDSEHRRNRAILELYEPGSTFKIIPLSAVLNERLSSPEEAVDCRVGTLRLAGKVYKEARHSYGILTFDEILAKSSNVGTIKLGLRLGNQRFYDYVRRFGFGEKTGIDLPGEQSGLLRPPSEWSKISIGALCIGQEIGVTPLQMVRAVATLANGGYLVRPHVVRRVLTSGGDLVQKPELVRQRILQEETVSAMLKALAMVVSDGTGRKAQLNGYTSAGKTGTAQKFINGRYSSTRFVASHVGFAPLENPVLAAVVVINEPQTSIYGGHVASPAFKQIMERSLIHLKVPPDLPPALPLDQAGLDRSPLEPLQPDAPAGVSVSEEPVTGEGFEQTVLNLLAEVPGRDSGQGTVAIDLHPQLLPDFRGKSLREVARECARRGLRLKVSGSGLAVGQRPPPGHPVLEGTVCEVFFSSHGTYEDASRQVALRQPGESQNRRRRSP